MGGMHISQKREQKSHRPVHPDILAVNTAVCFLNQTGSTHLHSCRGVNVRCVPGTALSASCVSHLNVVKWVEGSKRAQRGC